MYVERTSLISVDFLVLALLSFADHRDIIIKTTSLIAITPLSDKKEELMDALEMALKTETDAIAFYTEAARKTSYPVGKKMFQAITEDEKRHLEMIKQVVKGLHITHKDVSPMKNVKTVFEAMKKDLMKKVEATSDELEAFRIAMRMEKEGKDVYEKALSHAKSDKEKALLERLIQEEEQHYAIFSNTLQFLEDTGNWFMWEERGIVEGG